MWAHLLECVNNLAASFCVVWRCENIIDLNRETSCYNNLITKAQMHELQFHQRDHMLQFRNVPQMRKKGMKHWFYMRVKTQRGIKYNTKTSDTVTEQ